MLLHLRFLLGLLQLFGGRGGGPVEADGESMDPAAEALAVQCSRQFQVMKSE